MSELTEDQQRAYDAVLDGDNIFITGAAGTGKSFLIKKIANDLCADVTAATGIAAVNIDGRTLHSWGGYRPNSSIAGCYQKSDKWVEKRIRDCELLIIDEISMVSGEMLDYVNETIKRIKNSKPFGGIQLIVVGDFLQLPPVSKKGEPLKKFAFESLAWEEANFRNINMREVKRQEDSSFSLLLERVRTNEMTTDDKKIIISSKSDELSKHVKLYPTNSECDNENAVQLKKLDSEEVIFTSTHRETIYSSSAEAEYHKNVFHKNSLVKENITIKVGARVMMLTNLHIGCGVVNGSVGNVSYFENDCPMVDFDNGVSLFIARETFTASAPYGKEKDIVAMALITQVPLRLSWAITVHKSQGMSLDKVYCDMKRIFAPSQAYVALSRCRNLEGLAIDNFYPKAIRVSDLALEFMMGIKTKIV